MVVEEFEREHRIASDVFDGLPDGSPFKQHPQGIEALTLLVLLRPDVGRGRKMTWNEAAEALEQEFGLVADSGHLRSLCDRKLDVALQMDADWFRKGALQAVGNLNKVADINEIAHKTKEVFEQASSEAGEGFIDENGKLRVKASYRDVASLSKAAVSAAEKANELNAALGIGVRVEKAPMVALQNNTTVNLSDFFGGQTPKQADVVDAERVD